MANCIGYETLLVNSSVARGPAEAMVQGGVACAIFFIDPASQAKAVRYRPDQGKSQLPTSTFTPPTSTGGIPLKRGKSIVVAGDTNIRHSLFVAESGVAIVHCLYYDRVDVVDLGLGVDQDLLDSSEGVRQAAEQTNQKLNDVIKLLTKS